MAGVPTTCASRMLLEYKSPFDAAVVSSLRDAGAYINARTNCDEFAMGGLNVHSVFGPVRNPAATDAPRSAGGSSGGAAASVASNLCKIAIGSDTGGSVRLPAAYCGVVGLKPSYGMISRWGLVSYADSLDTIGIIGRTVDDVKPTFDVVAAPDGRDATCAAVEKRRNAVKSADALVERLSGSLDGLRIGVPAELFPSELESAAGDAVDGVLATLHQLGAEIVEVNLPSVRQTLGAYYVLALAEASSNLARYDGLQYGHFSSAESYAAAAAASRSAALGLEVQKRILLGTHALSAGAWDNYFLKAQKIRARIASEIDNVWSKVDMLVHPTALGGAPRLNEAVSEYAQDVLTVPANLSGIPHRAGGTSL
ncbi:hypothetical protein MCUN1_003631 [Malassezia cuniculi]|uniref:Amidase domain-containing protein n=1 Tax=Malassezia cuniculi TaxID=948313 RepID=A0AAF0EX30_9BASI|nr:hypothetical protein MCUN1_003631 [Malassezia cuniculi]